MKKTILLLFFIMFLTSFLRLWHLGGVPITPNWDEVAIGYNSFSILNTGMDEYGQKLPIVLRSFGDYKPALYSYLLLPFIKVLGLTVTAIRLPSALFGIMAVLGTFFLTIELLKLRKVEDNKSLSISLLATLFLAISPWHIQFSRAAFEANIALTLCIYGLLFFLIGLRKPAFFIVSAFIYGLSIHAYHSTRLFVPLLVVGLLFIFRKAIFVDPKRLILPSLVGLVFISPFLVFIFQGKAEQIFGRATQTSVFGRDQPKGLEPFYRIGHNYVSHFSPNWLFITGDNDRHHAPSTGLLYLWEFPFLIIGVIYLLRDKSKFRHVMLAWILLAPIPSSLTTEVPHAVRTLIILPSLQILIAIGVIKTLFNIKKVKANVGILAIATYGVSVIFLTIQYFHLYFFQMNHEYSRFWQFGYSDALSYSLQNNEKYKKVVVSNKLEQPYIFFLYYLKYDPATYLKNGGTQIGYEKKFDKYEFRNINWSQENHDGTMLYILSPNDERGEVLHTIRYFDGGDAFIIAE